MKAVREGAGVQGHALSQIINFSSPLGDPKRIYASRGDEAFLVRARRNGRVRAFVEKFK